MEWDGISRRMFLKLSAAGLFGGHFLPGFLSRAVAETSGGRKRTLIVIFQRGAADGLSLVPPLGDPDYYAMRPTIAIPASGELAALRLDGFFGLHPGLSALEPWWEQGSLAIVHQVGSPDQTRSHFDAQDYMESGTPGNKASDDGFLNRAMAASRFQFSSPLRAVALQPTLPRILWGRFPAISMASIKDFAGGGLRNPGVEQGFEAMYRGAVDRVLRGVGDEAFQALKTLNETEKKAEAREQASVGDAAMGGYPTTALGKRLHELAQLIKADVGLQIGVTDCGGWDTHVNQGAGKGQLSSRLKELGDALSAFAHDLGPRLENVVVVTMTEFGRTVRENGNRGTDHGHGSVMMVLGGKVRGKKVFSDWKGLKEAALFQGRDLPVVYDYRDVMGELLSKHMGVASLDKVFPKYGGHPSKWLGLV